jgi:hypothetical protein
MDLFEEKFLTNTMKSLIDTAAEARNFIED